MPGMGGSGKGQEPGRPAVSICHFERDEGMWPCGSGALKPRVLDSSAVGTTGQLLARLCARFLMAVYSG